MPSDQERPEPHALVLQMWMCAWLDGAASWSMPERERGDREAMEQLARLSQANADMEAEIAELRAKNARLAGRCERLEGKLSTALKWGLHHEFEECSTYDDPPGVCGCGAAIAEAEIRAALCESGEGE